MDERLVEAYRLDTDSWASFDELYESFEWVIPDDLNVADRICDRWADESGDDVAVYATAESGRERTVTFGDLRDRSNRLANYLAKSGVERGDRVAISLSQTPEALVSHLAVWKLGAVCVALSTLLGDEGLGYRLSDCDVTACIVESTNYETYQAARDGSTVDVTITDEPIDDPDARSLPDVYDHTSPSYTPVRTDPDDDAVIYYTSGTTGKPKGVVHGHRLLLGTLPSFVVSTSNLDLSRDDVYWSVPDWMWQGAFMTGVVPALFFGRPVLAYDRGSFDPEAAYRVLETYEVSVLHAPPTALRMLMDVEDPRARFDLDALRVVQSGGETVGGDIVEWISQEFENTVIHPAYGQTEAHLFVGDCSSMFDRPDGAIGRAMPGHTVRIVDPATREPTDTGKHGEIAIEYAGNPTCMKRYWDNPEETCEKIKDGLLLTGDIGHVDDRGFVYFSRRKDDVIISSGHRIGPEEIEAHLLGHPAVAEAGVVGVPHEVKGQIPKAFVQPSEDVDPTADLAAELQSAVRDRLATHKYPREIEFVDELPLTASGKVDRSELRSIAEESE